MWQSKSWTTYPSVISAQVSEKQIVLVILLLLLCNEFQPLPESVLDITIKWNSDFCYNETSNV